VKKLICLIALIAGSAFAIETPYSGALNERSLQNANFDASKYSAVLGNDSNKAELQLINKDGGNNCHTARFTWDFDEHAGAIGTASLGVKLPANAIIRQNFFHSETTPVSAGAGTMAFSCEDANNLFSAAAITGWTAGTFQAGAASDGAVGNMVDDIAAECEITATIASAVYTAGKVVGFVDYCESN